MFESVYSDKYIFNCDVIIHQFDDKGCHRLIVNDEAGTIMDWDRVSVLNDYMALHFDLSPEENSMVLHLTFGRLESVGEEHG